MMTDKKTNTLTLTPEDSATIERALRLVAIEDNKRVDAGDDGAGFHLGHATRASTLSTAIEDGAVVFVSPKADYFDGRPGYSFCGDCDKRVDNSLVDGAPCPYCGGTVEVLTDECTQGCRDAHVQNCSRWRSEIPVGTAFQWADDDDETGGAS